ncbi:MAG: Fe(3+) dicitrate transport protein [Polyangiales bacterium]|jgi:Fe(3+) dicitrate transport protein
MKVVFNKGAITVLLWAFGVFSAAAQEAPSPEPPPPAEVEVPEIPVETPPQETEEPPGSTEPPLGEDLGDDPVEVPVEPVEPGEPEPSEPEPVEAPDVSAEAPGAETDEGEELSEEDWDEGASYGSSPVLETPAEPSEGETEPAELPESLEASGRATGYVRDRLRYAGSVTHIGPEELETLEYDDPHSVLRGSGVYVRNEDGFGLRPNIGLRGGNPERSRRVTLMEDGVLFGPAPYSAPAAYYFPLMTRMRSVDVFKGPAALLYGPQTIGGAIDLGTRQVPTSSEGEVDLSYGLFNSRKIHLHWGTSNRWGGFLIEAVDVASDGFKEIDGSNEDTGFWRSDFMVRSFLQTNPAGRVFNRLDLKLGFQRETSNETYLGLSDADFAENPVRRYAASAGDRMEWWRTQGQLTWRLGVGDNFELVTDLYRHDFYREWDRLSGFEGGPALRDILLAPTGARAVYYDVLRGAADSDINEGTRLLRANNRRRYVSQGIQSRARGSFRTGPVRHEVELGARFHHDRIDRDHLGSLHRMVNGDVVQDGESFATTVNTGEAMATSAYLVYGLEAFGVTLRPGIRTEIVHTRFAQEGNRQNETRAVALPGVGLTYGFTPTLSAVAGVHRGFSPVAPGQAEEVQPETSLAYELGGRFLDESKGRLIEAIGFVNDYGNLQGQCAFATGCTEEMLDRQFNGGEVLVWGVEAGATWSFELNDAFSMPARVSYTYTDSSFRTDFESQDPTLGRVSIGDQLPYIPRHQGQLQVGLEHPMGGLRAIANFVGEMRESASQGEPDVEDVTERYATLDLIGWVKATARIRVYGRLENLTNAQPLTSRRPFGARPLRPFSLQVGIRFSL